MRPNRIAKVPIRTCAGCRERMPQDALIRIVRRTDGALAVDGGPRGREPGRGAYVCARRSCVEKATQGGLRRTFRYEGPLPDALKEELLARVGEREGNDGEAQGS